MKLDVRKKDSRIKTKKYDLERSLEEVKAV